MSNTAPAKQVRKPKKLPFVIMCILSAIDYSYLFGLSYRGCGEEA